MHIGYARVSTEEQTVELQKDALTAAGCSRIFTDVASGANTERPGLAEALSFVRSGDTLVVWKLDRLGRSLQHLIQTIRDLEQRHVSFKSLTENIDTTTYCWDVFDRLVRAVEGAATPACPVDPVRLNSGGGLYTDGGGNNWAPDSYFSGGSTSLNGYAIANTTDDPLYQAVRFGTGFSYALPLAQAGSYTLTLKFNEPSKTAAGQRKFDVTAEGTVILDDFDIYAAAGGKNIAHDRTFTVTVNDGTLDLAFTGVLDNALVSAVEITWAGAAPPAPLVSYAYRGDGLRHSKTVGANTTTYSWDVGAGLPVILQDGAYTYVYGKGLISQTDGSGSHTYFLGNALGSTEALTDVTVS